MIQNLGTKVFASEAPLVWRGQTSKYFDTLIIPSDAADNKSMTQMKIGTNNNKFSLIWVWI